MPREFIARACPGSGLIPAYIDPYRKHPMSPRPSTLRTPLFYLLPFFTAFTLFWLIPILQGFWLSLQSNTLYGSPDFVGIKHYTFLLDDGRFFLSLKNTLIYTLSILMCILPISLLLAQLLRRCYARLKGVITFTLLLPGLTPPLVLALLFMLVFLGRYGLFNRLLLDPLGFPYIDWVKDPAFVMPALILQAIWRWTGFVTFFILSALEGIPKTYDELAKTEGAGPVRRFTSVTLPLLKNCLIFCAIFLFIDAFVMFEGAYMLLGSSGGTGDAALLLVGYTYQTAFFHGNFSSAAAMSFSVVPFLLGVLWLLVWLGPRPWKKLAISKHGGRHA